MAARGRSATLAAMRWRSRIGRGLLPAALVLFSCGPLAGAGPDPFDTYRVLGDDGAIFEWSPGGSLLRRAAAPLGSAELGGAVKDLVAFAGGSRLLVLAPNREDAGKGRKRREGLAVIYDTSRPIPAVLHRVPFAGDGYGVAAAPDGRRCYVLAARLDGGRGGPRFWIHALDAEAGEVSGTTLIERPASGLTVAPDGTRLFVSFENRIQSYTTGPFLASWHYRSPGINGALYFPPTGNVLHAVRTGGIALFDPAVILSRDRSVPRDESDDSTGAIPLPFGPSAILFAPDRPWAAAVGADAVEFIDLSRGRSIPAAANAAALQEADLVRPLRFLPGGDLVVALFPAARTAAVSAPELPAPAPDAGAGGADNAEVEAAAGSASVAGAAPAADGLVSEDEAGAGPPRADVDGAPDRGAGGGGGDEAGATPADAGTAAALASPAAAGAFDAASPAPIEPPPDAGLAEPIVAAPPPREIAEPEMAPEPPAPPANGLFLTGRLSGGHALVAELVLYGPGSIIREFARVAPADDGRFRIPLPPPGTYRLMPVGEASRPVDSQPNFRTVIVEGGRERSELDFFNRKAAGEGVDTSP